MYGPRKQLHVYNFERMTHNFISKSILQVGPFGFWTYRGAQTQVCGAFIFFPTGRTVQAVQLVDPEDLVYLSFQYVRTR